MQNAYLTLTPDVARLQIELTAGPKVAREIVRTIDINHDGRVSLPEAQTYASTVLRRSALTIDGRPAALRVISVSVPPVLAVLGAHGTIVIVAAASRADRVGSATLVYRNGYAPAESRCDANIFLKAAARVRYRVLVQRHLQAGRVLIVRYRTDISA